MEYKEIDVFIPASYIDVVSLILCECGSQGSIIHDDENYDDLIRLTAYFPTDDTVAEGQVRARLKALEERDPRLSSWRIAVHAANDKEWLYKWQDYFHPSRMTSRLWVEPAWETQEIATGEQMIKIDPGVSFGSGLHATTSMCAAYLEKVITLDQLVYDVGTGTGILAIAAALLGAKHVTAVDLDETAVAQAKINVELNDVTDRVDVLHSDLLEAVSAAGRKADIVVANLVTDAVLALLPSLLPYLHEDSRVIVSGIIDDRLDEVREAAARDYDWVDESQRDGWYAVLLRRK